MSKNRDFDKNIEEDWWYSEPHINHLTQTKKESIISEVLDVGAFEKSMGENDEDGWYSEPHINHVTKTKKESIMSEILGDIY